MTLTKSIRFVLLLPLWLTFVSFSPMAWGLESDRQQPIEISADSAELDENNYTASYTGGVVLTQGTLRIVADKLTITATADGKVKKVTAAGQLAEFSQQPEPGSANLTAKAELIDYLVEDEKILLKGQASAVQQDNLFKGDIIQYDLRNKKLQAEGATEEQGGSGRVKMILQPQITTHKEALQPDAEAKTDTAPTKAKQN